MWPGRPTKHFFVDEAGDLTLFDKRGKSLIGREGVSNYFMIGMIDLPDPYEAWRELEDLRAELLRDPYFTGVPSLQPESNKTALAFHAKDDALEVKREVIRVLSYLGGKVIVGIRRKDALVREYRLLYKQTGRKGTENDVYDDLVTRVFQGRLHPANHNDVVFARRGKKDRTKALEKALENAVRYTASRNLRMSMPGEVSSAFPTAEVGLQVIDYYLWAVQRMFEKGEERFFRALEPQYEFVMDLDDKRKKRGGEWYSDTNRLELKKIKPFAS